MSPRRAKLAWRCRRGMRELDLVLTGFLERGFDALSESDKAAFEGLLEHPDQEILAWITGTAAPPDGGLERVVSAIRAAASASPPSEPGA